MTVQKDFKTIQNFVITNSGLHLAKDMAKHHIHLAKNELGKFPNNHWKKSLISICDIFNQKELDYRKPNFEILFYNHINLHIFIYISFRSNKKKEKKEKNTFLNS